MGIEKTASGGKESDQASDLDSPTSAGSGDLAQGDSPTVSGGNSHTTSGTYDWAAGTLYEQN